MLDYVERYPTYQLNGFYAKNGIKIFGRYFRKEWDDKNNILYLNTFKFGRNFCITSPGVIDKMELIQAALDECKMVYDNLPEYCFQDNDGVGSDGASGMD